MKEPCLYTRRRFLQSGLAGGALTWTVPGFLHATMQQLHAAAADSPVALPTGKDGPILFIVQLAGGNDGLNTVVPHGDDDYHRARPTLRIPPGECLELNDRIGLHPRLAGLKSLYDDGLLAVIQGVGYPNPNRSHFRSMEIWQTASDADRFESHGWIGRYFDHQCGGEDPRVGIALSDEPPQAFLAARPTGVTFRNPGQFRFFGLEADEETELFEEVFGLDDETAGGSVETLGGAPSMPGGVSPLDFLRRTALDAEASSDSIRRMIHSAKNQADYPKSRLSRDLKLVGKFIAGESPTRMYYVSHGGFDTHSKQSNAHANRLGQFGDALRAFLSDLRAQGNLDRVQVLTFSEFGRRVKENASQGTDHGAAAPVFIAGGRIRAGLYGAPPRLSEEGLVGGDVAHDIDFRSIYATLLERHLGAPSHPILGKAFPLLDLLPGEIIVSS